MNKASKNVLMIILGLVVAGVLARFVFFKDEFEQRSADMEKLGQWEAQYKADHPNATKADMDAAFKDGIDTMAQRKTDWLADHPGATEAEADVALEEAFKKLDPEPTEPVQE